MTSVDAACTCSTLGVFNLAFNQLESLPAGIGSALPSLQQLYVSDNRLTALPASLSSCPLTDLFLSGNPLKKLPPCIAAMTSLVKLSLAACLLSELPEGVGSLAHLEFLDVSFNSIKKLPNALSSLRQVPSMPF